LKLADAEIRRPLSRKNEEKVLFSIWKTSPQKNKKTPQKKEQKENQKRSSLISLSSCLPIGSPLFALIIASKLSSRQ
jgi:hypothetical protein